MVTQYGMSEKFGLIGLESIQNRYLDGRAVMNCGEATAAEIDQEVMKMLKGAYAEAKRMLSEHRETMDQIAGFLIEKETITGKEFMKIYRRCEGIPEPEEKKEENPVKGNNRKQIVGDTYMFTSAGEYKIRYVAYDANQNYTVVEFAVNCR